MSRIAKMTIAVPAGVDVSVKEELITVKGGGAELKLVPNALVKVSSQDGKLSFAPVDESREANAMSGTMRQLVNNMVVGVSKGFEKKLTLVGVGFRAQASGSKLNLSIGFSHPVNVEPPAGITFEVEGNNKLHIRGISKQAVGEAAANIRKIRKPEPYKGKGVRYAGERVRRKVGKAGK